MKNIIDTPEALVGWHSLNGAELTVIADPVPVSQALPNTLQVKIPSGKLGPIGFGNEGYNGQNFFYLNPIISNILLRAGGLKVDTTLTYKASFFYRFPTASAFKGNAVVGFQTASGLSLGSVSTPLNGAQTAWLQVNVTFKPSQTTFNNNNYFSIVVDGAAAADQTINFAMISLFPPTYKSKVNGMRLDLANVSNGIENGQTISQVT